MDPSCSHGDQPAEREEDVDGCQPDHQLEVRPEDGGCDVDCDEQRENGQCDGSEREEVAAKAEPVFAFDHQNKGRTFRVDEVTASANVHDYDGLVLTGGGPDTDSLYIVPDAVCFVAEFFSQGRPVGAISGSLRTMIEAGLVRGRRMTSGPNLADELRNAGADWSDEAVVVDQGLVTSRTRGDLPGFCDKIVVEIAEGVHTGQVAMT